MKKKETILPEFKNEAQEAEYWDEHSPLDLITKPRVQKIKIRGAKDRPITIRLDNDTRDKLNKLAAEQNMGPSTLARLVLTQAVERKNELTRFSLSDAFMSGVAEKLAHKEKLPVTRER